jgi:hypothetical protein
MSDIFISYNHEDRLRAQLFAQALEGRGWSIFWDRTIPTGKTWRETIGKELSEARCVIVLWSKTSIESEWVREEADDAKARRVLVPVRIDDVRPPIGFRGIQTADLADWRPTEPTSAFDGLAADIRALIGSSLSEEAPLSYAASKPHRAQPPPAPSAPPAPSFPPPSGDKKLDRPSSPHLGTASFILATDVPRRGFITISKILLWALYLIDICLVIFVSMGLIAMTRERFAQYDWNVFTTSVISLATFVGITVLLRRSIRAALG